MGFLFWRKLEPKAPWPTPEDNYNLDGIWVRNMPIQKPKYGPHNDYLRQLSMRMMLPQHDSQQSYGSPYGSSNRGLLGDIWGEI
jgi:hypothetical protein